jgi:phosphohistidine swiveling domain-containing protein
MLFSYPNTLTTGVISTAMPNISSQTYIVEFDSEDSLVPSLVGSKSASIGDLISNETVVPPGFVIRAAAFDEFTSSVETEIAEILTTVDVENASSAFNASDAISELLESLPTPSGLEDEIAERLGRNETAYAVRSSATAEDLQNASFAGMYDTFLNAIGSESVMSRVRNVWNSYYAGRAISYRQQQGIPHGSGSMAVLIMELVDSEAGGVIFTRDPRDGTDQIIVNVALGLGEGVVSGVAQADSFTLDSHSLEIISRNVIDKEQMVVPGTTGSIGREPVTAEKRSLAALSDKQILAVAQAAMTIKNSAGNDRDIEFAVEGETVHILQSRPITTGAKQETEFPVEWDNPDDELLYWTAGKLPSLPLVIDYMMMASIAQKRSVDTVGQYMGRNDLRKLVNGYLFDAESPRDPEETRARLFKHHLQGRRYLEKRTTFYYEEIEPLLISNLEKIEQARPDDNAPIPDHIVNLRRAMGLAADHQSDLHWRGWAGFPKGTNDFGALFSKITGKPAVEASSLTMALDHMTARLTKRLIGIALLVKNDEWLTEVFTSRNYESIFARGNGKRQAVRTFRARFRALLKVWGRRNGIGYGSAWKPTDPTWNMNPEIPLDSIGSFIRQDLDSLGRSHVELVRIREAAIRAVRKEIGRDTKLRKEFEFELFRVTNRVQMMENHNYLIEQRTFGEYRESINRAGMSLASEGFIDTSDDIFYLRLAQLESAVEADDCSGLRSLILQAKYEEVENSKLTRPDYLGTKPPGTEKDGSDEDKPLRGLSDDGQILHGEPSSAGSFTGTARVVITRTSRPPDVKKGDILVTENTGPDWVPIFPLIGGLILDGGDNFQHASLISREYGIPCVIQSKEATKIIADGQLVTVDGSAGTVTLNPMV